MEKILDDVLTLTRQGTATASRVYFRHAPAGMRLVRGEPIRKVQAGLASRGYLQIEEIDGVFGEDTLNAITAFQLERRMPLTQGVDGDTWRALLRDLPLPSTLDLCLQITGAFEGHGFGKVAGNFDGAGVTWGIIGFTLSSGEIRRIVRAVEQKRADIVDICFGEKASVFREILATDDMHRRAWADTISTGPHRSEVIEPWRSAFEKLGGFPEVQTVQMQLVDEYWQRARRDANLFNMGTELDMALMFDIAVQNGGISADEQRRIDGRLRRMVQPDPEEVRIIIANAIAEHSKPQWVEDVRMRKLTLATGRGEVHGARYDLQYWGFTA